ncbi:glycosyltransferase family 2 protein [Patescibacteria group bacterium]|nr:glycosyltransferase family 2 protein [Patescibacteria group bacterium]
MKVYLHFLTWNDKKYLPDLFESIEAQTYEDFTVRVLDNGSADGTLEYLQQHYPHTVVARNVRNQGFAGGHNQLIEFTLQHLRDDTEDPFIIIMNSDMILTPTIVEELVKALEGDAKLASVQPKIYRAFGENVGDEFLEETMKSDIIDTTGLKVHKDWRMVDRGAGELDQGQYDEVRDIFGSTGTMALFRISALRSIMIDGKVFDDDFFAYREDCDLAWRLQKVGWKTKFVPSATAYHYRGMFGVEKQTLLGRLKNRRGQRSFFAALSTRNQLFVLLKNLSLAGLIRSFPWLVFGEGMRITYGFVFEKETRRRLIGMWTLVPKMMRKRKVIRSMTKVAEKEIRAYAR